MAFNPYAMGYPQYSQDINTLQNQLNQLRNMQSQIQSPIPNQPQPPQNGVIQIGTYVVVKNIQDMENYPVPVDGTPVNVFVEGTGAFYSKKMTNGTVSCQPFSFAPLNTVKTDTQPEPQKSDEAPEWATATGGAENETVTLQINRNGIAMTTGTASFNPATTTNAESMSVSTIIEVNTVCPCSGNGLTALPITITNTGNEATYTFIILSVIKLA